MNYWIRKIGLRNTAKIIAFLGLLAAIVLLLLKNEVGALNSFSFYFGVLLLSLPHWLLYFIIAEKREKRERMVYISIFLLATNMLLLMLGYKTLLFMLTILQNISVSVVFLLLKIKEKNSSAANNIEKQ